MPTLNLGSLRCALVACRTALASAQPSHGARRKYQRRPGGGRKSISPRSGFCRHRLRAAHGLPVEGSAQEFRQRQCHSPLFSAVAAGRILCAAVASGVGGVRRDGGDCLGMAKLGRDQGKAPLAQEAVGNNPTDRGKKRDQAQSAGGRPWRPALAYRRRGQSARREVAGPDAGRDRGSAAQADEARPKISAWTKATLASPPTSRCGSGDISRMCLERKASSPT